jgi:Dyp-type peroxidase family
VLLIVFAANAGAVAHALTQVGPTQGMSEAGRLPPTLPLAEAQGREHFGFADGISQPILAGTVDAERFPDSTHVTALGEFVLGYRDQTGSLAGVPGLGMSDDFGRNGSYFVFTQYEQHVDEFWRIMHERTRDRQGGLAAEALASKIVGRMPDGTPLVPYGNREDNEFDFTEDPYGYGCPLGSHIRRSHERGSVDEARNRHRILRRGRSYGPRVLPGVPDPRERGLFFACLNADLERQFEFIFQNWTNNPAFSGLRAECDPLVGSAPGGCPGLFTVPGLPTPAQVSGLRRFVQVRGGQYFFLPGITALRSLAEGLCGTVGN